MNKQIKNDLRGIKENQRKKINNKTGMRPKIS